MLRRNHQTRSEEPAQAERPRVEGLLIGRIVSLSELGVPRVDYPGDPAAGPCEARSTVALEARHVGRDVALAFESGRLDAPIVIGVLHAPLVELIEERGRGRFERVAELDGERVVLEAEKEIILQCGEASITLQRDGKVLIRGTHVLSRSSGPNRVKGASVQIN